MFPTLVRLDYDSSGGGPTEGLRACALGTDNRRRGTGLPPGASRSMVQKLTLLTAFAEPERNAR
jgi:hypothetical protein